MPQPDAQRNRTYAGDMMAEGKLAEEQVYDWLSQQPGVIDVDDLRDETEWQEQDVDFRAHFPTGRQWLVEAKRDVHLAGDNFLFEVLRINHTQLRVPLTLGWSARSAAQTFALVSPLEQRIYTVEKVDFVDAMLAYTRHCRSLDYWRTVPTDAIKSTVVLLLPKSNVRHRVYEYRDGWWLPLPV